MHGVSLLLQALTAVHIIVVDNSVIKTTISKPSRGDIRERYATVIVKHVNSIDFGTHDGSDL